MYYSINLFYLFIYLLSISPKGRVPQKAKSLYEVVPKTEHIDTYSTYTQ